MAGTGGGGNGEGGAAASGGGGSTGFASSTNLAEISDWLTKLLLGAGLVDLTRLGKPLKGMINTVAKGLGASATAVSGSPVVAAASILIMFVVLGFLDGYILTTIWYAKRLQELGF